MGTTMRGGYGRVDSRMRRLQCQPTPRMPQPALFLLSFRMAEDSGSEATSSAPRPSSARRGPAVLEALVEEELLEWYLMTAEERWAESQRLWATFRLLGGSLEPEPDSQSPFDFQGIRGEGPPHGRAGLHSVRRGGV